jgi:hypothetical protein
MTMSPAQELYESIVGGGLPFLERMVAEAWGEDLHLDYKEAERGSAPMSIGDRRNLAKAVSGFANSDGGVVCWGVSCRKAAPDEPDVANDLKPIADIQLFYSDITRFSAELVSPAVSGVEHTVIPHERDMGFVVTFVPRSDGEPHMARAKGQHRFYYRAGESFRPMEAFQLADRYGRRPQPTLEFTYRLDRHGSTTRDCDLDVVVGIRNAGLGLAKFPALQLAENPSFKISTFGLDGNRKTGLPERVRTSAGASSMLRTFAGGSGDVIYPNSQLDITIVSLVVSRENGPPEEVSMRYALHCDGFSTSGVCSMSRAEITSSGHG